MVLTLSNRRSISSLILVIRVIQYKTFLHFLLRLLLLILQHFHRQRNVRCFCIVEEILFVVVIPREHRVQLLHLLSLQLNKEEKTNNFQWNFVFILNVLHCFSPSVFPPQLSFGPSFGQYNCSICMGFT